jgi:urocanate hydratase
MTMTDRPQSATTPTRAVERALSLLVEVCAEGEIGLSECARRVGLSGGTAWRLLRTMETADFVERDARGLFSPGPRLIQLGAKALGQRALVGVAEPSLQRIVAETGESAYVSVVGPGETALYVAMVEGTHSVRHTSWVGRTVPLADSAVGAALHGSAPDFGYVAVRSAVEPDVTAIAAPVRRPGGVMAAISVVGPTYRIDDKTMEKYGEVVSREARLVAEKIGRPR